jgi:hypothetical protein
MTTLRYEQPTLPAMLRAGGQTHEVLARENKRLKEEVAFLSDVRDHYLVRAAREQELNVQTIRKLQALLNEREERLHLKRSLYCDDEGIPLEDRHDGDNVAHGELFWRMREAEERVQMLQFELE